MAYQREEDQMPVRIDWLRLHLMGAVLMLLLSVVGLTGCEAWQSNQVVERDNRRIRVSSYQPLNPKTLWELSTEESCEIYSYEDFRERMLNDLSNETSRVALIQQTANGQLAMPIGQLSTEGQSYAVIQDYAKYLTLSRVIQIMLPQDLLVVEDEADADSPIDWSQARIQIVSDLQPADAIVDPGFEKVFEAPISLYVGIGVRTRADVVTQEADVTLNGIMGLGAEAKAGALSGVLSVQSLGITGEVVSPLMPSPSDLSDASIQNALQSLGAIKAQIYDQKAVVYPQLIGFEPTGIPAELMDLVTARISTTPIYYAVKGCEGTGGLYIDWDVKPAAPEVIECDVPYEMAEPIVSETNANDELNADEIEIEIEAVDE